jgi:hypothetical protein
VELRMSWDATFDEPVKLPNGRMASTLREADQYITRLPKAERRKRGRRQCTA